MNLQRLKSSKTHSLGIPLDIYIFVINSFRVERTTVDLSYKVVHGREGHGRKCEAFSTALYVWYTTLHFSGISVQCGRVLHWGPHQVQYVLTLPSHGQQEGGDVLIWEDPNKLQFWHFSDHAIEINYTLFCTVTWRHWHSDVQHTHVLFLVVLKKKTEENKRMWTSFSTYIWYLHCSCFNKAGPLR